MIEWLKRKFRKSPQKELYYRIYISLSTEDDITIAADIQEDDNARSAFAMFIYNGLKEPLQQKFIQFLEHNKDIPSFQKVLQKIDLLQITEKSIRERQAPCIRPLDIFKVIGN